jgi:trigger factor
MMNDAADYLKDVKSPGALKRVLEFEVPRERVEGEIGDIVDGIRREVTLPGFRKGKAPLDVVRARFTETARKEAIERLIPEAYQEGLKKAVLRPALAPELSSLKYGDEGPLTFHITIELYPEIDLKPYKGLKVKKETRQVADADIDRETESLRERFANYIPLETGAEPKHILVLDYWRIGDDGEPVKASRVTGYPVELGSGRLVKEFDAALVGAKAGDARTIEVTYQDDCPEVELRGKTVKFGVEVKQVMNKVLPDLDEAFLKGLGVESVDAMRSKLKTGLAAAYERDAASKAKQEILSRIAEETSFEVPEGFLAMAIESMLKPYREEFERAGEPDAETKLAEVRERIKPVALKLVKEEFVVDEIAKRENISVEEKEIEEILEALAARRGIPVAAAKAEADNSDEPGRWRREIVRNKVLDFLLQNAEVQG